jgi:hypothetical protein
MSVSLYFEQKTAQRGGKMRTVRLGLPRADFSQVMVTMRLWLDEARHNPERFDCHQNGDEIVLSVDFMDHAAAEAFSRRFTGEISTPLAVASAQPARDAETADREQRRPRSSERSPRRQSRYRRLGESAT